MNLIQLKNVNDKIKITENFKAKEFKCNHCNELLIDKDLVDQLELFRSEIGNKPIVITSGYRCQTHNRAVGGSSQSYHLRGRAVDFVLLSQFKAVEIFMLATKIFNRVGLYQSGVNPNSAYMHVDNGPKGTYWTSFPVKTDKKTRRTYVYFNRLENVYDYMKQDTAIDWYNLVI